MRAGLIAAQNVAHARRLELEDAAGEALGEDLVGWPGRRAAGPRAPASTPWRFSISLSASSIRVSVVSPRKSILRSRQFLEPVHVVLGDNFVAVGAVERHQLF